MSSKLVKKFVETDLSELRKVSEPIDLNDVSLTSAIEHKLLTTFMCLSRRLQGLSGVQVGYRYCVILLRYKKQDEPIIVYNPEVLKTIGSRKSNEGCLSEGEKRYIVKRPLFAKVRYYTKYREEVIEWLPYRKARIFCHEVDHLKGILLQDIGKIVEG